MAHIRKLTDKRRALPWRAQIRRKGHKVQIKMFASKREAEHWANEQEVIFASRLPINDRLITAETGPTDTRGIRIPF